MFGLGLCLSYEKAYYKFLRKINNQKKINKNFFKSMKKSASILLIGLFTISAVLLFLNSPAALLTTHFASDSFLHTQPPSISVTHENIADNDLQAVPFRIKTYRGQFVLIGGELGEK